MTIEELLNIKRILKFITHNRVFHADDVFAYSVLNTLFPNNTLTRTRDIDIINNADIVFDVGGVYDKDNNRFDHHQKDFILTRGKNNVPYSSFGLIWEKFGLEYCKLFINENNELNHTLYRKIDERLVQPIDAVDNGIKIIENKCPGLFPVEVSGIISSFNPTWNEEQNHDLKFIEASNYAKTILDNIIRGILGKLLSVETVENRIRFANDRNLEYIYLDEFMPWQETVLSSAIANNLKYVIFKEEENNYRITTIPVDFNNMFEPRKALPSNWAGKTPEELNKIIGISDAIFCHKGLFIAGAKSKESIMKMVKLALAN